MNKVARSILFVLIIAFHHHANADTDLIDIGSYLVVRSLVTQCIEPDELITRIIKVNENGAIGVIDTQRIVKGRSVKDVEALFINEIKAHQGNPTISLSVEHIKPGSDIQQYEEKHKNDINKWFECNSNLRLKERRYKSLEKIFDDGNRLPADKSIPIQDLDRIFGDHHPISMKK